MFFRAGLKKGKKIVSAGLQRQLELLFRQGAAVCCPAPPAARLSFTVAASHTAILYSLKALGLFLL